TWQGPTGRSGVWHGIGNNRPGSVTERGGAVVSGETAISCNGARWTPGILPSRAHPPGGARLHGPGTTMRPDDIPRTRLPHAAAHRLALGRPTRGPGLAGAVRAPSRRPPGAGERAAPHRLCPVRCAGYRAVPGGVAAGMAAPPGVHRRR